jgi:hypothetical protein
VFFVWVGDISTVWPFNATPEQIKARSVPRVEIFKMPGGTEYIVHDVDADNIIIGKARFSGHVKVSESMSVDGFGGLSILDTPTLAKPRMERLEASVDDSSESSYTSIKRLHHFILPRLVLLSLETPMALTRLARPLVMFFGSMEGV